MDPLLRVKYYLKYLQEMEDENAMNVINLLKLFQLNDKDSIKSLIVNDHYRLLLHLAIKTAGCEFVLFIYIYHPY